MLGPEPASPEVAMRKALLAILLAAAFAGAALPQPLFAQGMDPTHPACRGLLQALLAGANPPPATGCLNSEDVVR